MYTVPIDDITITTVTEFVNQRNRESIILDYKDDWPKDLEKVMAAMANTQGGLILIGVGEEEKTGLPKEVAGVDLEQGQDALRQRVISKAYQAIYPPVMPEVAVCPLEQNPSRAVVVIRVAQSDRTPHAVDQRRRVYVRVDSITEPHTLATLHELEWLRDRRRQAEEGRDVLIEAAKERAAWILQQSAEPGKLPLLRTWVVPYFYSGEQVLSLNQVKELLRKRRVASDLMRGSWSFPNYAYKGRSVSMGYCVYCIDREFEYDELGASGLVFSEMILDSVLDNAEYKHLNVHLILGHIDALLKFADLAYKQGDLWGLLQIHASLHNIQGHTLFVQQNRWVDDSQLLRFPNKVVTIFQATVINQDLNNVRLHLIKQATKSLLWSFGHDWTDSNFENWYSKNVQP